MRPRILYLYAQIYRPETLHAHRTVQMLELLRNQGCHVDLLTLPSKYNLPLNAFDSLYTTCKIPFMQTMPYYGYGIRRISTVFVFFFSMLHLLVRHRYKAIHCADRSWRLGSFAAWLQQAKLIVELRHASNEKCKLGKCSSKCRVIFAPVNLIISEIAISVKKQRNFFIEGKTAWLPLCASNRILTGQYKLKTEISPDKDRTPLQLTVFSHEKNLLSMSGFFYILPQLLEKYPQLNIQIAGGNSSAVEKMKVQLGKFNSSLLNHIAFYNEITDELINQLCEVADLIFLPRAYSENAALLAINVLATGRAVIAVKSKPYLDIMTNENSIQISSKPNELFTEIDNLLKNPQLRKRRAFLNEQANKNNSNIEVLKSLSSCYSNIIK